MSLSSDIEFGLKDAGGNTVVEFNGVRSFGILDYADGLEFLDQGGAVQTRVTTLLVCSFVWQLRDDGLISIVNSDQPAAKALVGVRLRIDRIAPQDDGATSLLFVARAS